MRSSEEPCGSPARRSLLSLPLRRQTGGCSLQGGGEERPGSSEGGEQLHCPLCPHTDTNPAKLQEHVNREHLDVLSPAVGQQHSCPLCPQTFRNPSLLQEHFSCQHDPDLSPQTGQTCPTCPVCGETGWSQQQLQVGETCHRSGSRDIHTHVLKF